MTSNDSTDQPNLEQLFHGALEQDAGPRRERFLDQACADHADLRRRVEGLLAAHSDTGSFLEEPIVKGVPSEAAIDAGPGTKIGPYKLLQAIGEGGMGVVYMAEQEEPVRRKVALKIIKLGMDTKQVIARFEAERQALALMEHPNIASVLDAGATDSGRPYFVMELVRGIPINEYCDTHKLPTRERLDLFSDTCRAVQHAHQKGIIHRDIKPGNVLVTSHDGRAVVKIIDFGVAKATGQKLTEKTLFTEFRQVIGTPEYMSPEQAEMSGLDVDTRSDIYSLGVLLYLMLTGSTPFDARRLRTAGYEEMTRMIREDEPQKPSTRISKLGAEIGDLARSRGSESGSLAKLMRGDLDWIVMRAMAKDRTRRYDSASALADDVERHLANQPVLAGPPSSVYRISKLIRRNRGLVFASCLAALGILVGLGLAMGGYFAAKAEAGRSNRIASSLTEMLAIVGNDESGEVDVSGLLATARDVFGEDHATVAATLSALGGQLRNAGDSVGAEELYTEALATYRKAFGGDHRVVGRALVNLGTMQAQNGKVDMALGSLRESLLLEPKTSGGSALTASQARRELAKLLSDRGDYAEACGLLEQALDLMSASGAPEHYERLVVLEEWLRIAISDPNHGDMKPMFVEMLRTAKLAFPEGSLMAANAAFGMGMYLGREGRKTEAIPVLREALTAFEALPSPPVTYLVSALDMQYQMLRNSQSSADQDEADSVLLRFLELADRVWDANSDLMGANLQAASARFMERGDYSKVLVVGVPFAQYAKHNGSIEEQVYVANMIGRAVWEVAKSPESAAEDLERSLAVLDEFPAVAKVEVRVRVLRALIAARQGRDHDLRSALTSARSQTAVSESGTSDFLDEVEQVATSQGLLL